MILDKKLIDTLRSVDTPSICNAIEVAQGKRGFAQFTRGTVLSCDPKLPAICGYARTAKIRALVPPEEPVDVLQERRMAYYKYMSEGSSPSITVIEDLDYPNCVGAFWGEVNTTIHQGFGIMGAITNGVMRDLGDLAPGFQVVAGSVGPSHAFVHVVEIATPVEIFGMSVSDGDFIHADRHGAVVVPPDILPKLSDSLKKMQDAEQLVLGPAREPGFDFERFQMAWEAFENART